MSYKICPLCNARLDPGELCDCQKKEPTPEEIKQANIDKIWADLEKMGLPRKENHEVHQNHHKRRPRAPRRRKR